MRKKASSGPPGQKAKVLSFMADAETVRAVEAVADSRGLSTSNFLRAVIEKALEPVRDRAEEAGAVIKSLTPSSQKKVARVSAIQKILIGLRAEQSKAGALDDVFQDGDGEAVAEKIKALELELVGLKKAVRKELAGLEKSAEKEAEVEEAGDGAGPGVIYALPWPEGEEDTPCPKCGAVVDLEGVELEAGKSVRVSCPSCRAVIKFSAAEDEEAEDEEAEDEEAEDEEAETTEAEKKAARFLKITELIDSLRGCREKRSILDNLLDGGPPVCDLLIKEFEREREAAVLDEEFFERLCASAVRAVEIREKIQELEASGADAARPLVEELEVELDELRASLPAGGGKKPPKKKSGLFSNWSIFQ